MGVLLLLHLVFIHVLKNFVYQEERKTFYSPEIRSVLRANPFSYRCGSGPSQQQFREDFSFEHSLMVFYSRIFVGTICLEISRGGLELSEKFC